MRAIPFNVAEAIFEPFWDPQLSRLPEWQVDDGSAHGLEVRQFWCWVEFSWARSPHAGPALSMQRSLDLECSGYDLLLFSLVAPEGAEVAITVQTDVGKRQCRERAPALKREFGVELAGAERVITIRLEITAPPSDGAGAGWLNWVGLQNRELLARHLTALRDTAAAMERLLQPATQRPRMEPALGVVITADELASARRFHRQAVARSGRSPFADVAAEALATDPAELVNDVILTAPDTRYGREREHGVASVGRPAAVLQAAVVLEDPALLRRGAELALAVALTPVWDWGFIARFPGSGFEIRAFLQGICSSDLAHALDLAGDLFTHAGRQLLQRRLGEDGLGAINFSAWRHEYIHHCNQLALFSTGRLAAYGVLRGEWPRVAPYQELAYQELVASVEGIILPDGGFVEGPNYFAGTMARALHALAQHSRSLGEPPHAHVPAALARSDALAAALVSTDDDTDVIPLCDAHAVLDAEWLALLAAARPHSQWVTAYRRAERRHGFVLTSLYAMAQAERIPARVPPPEALVELPGMGIVASHRPLHGHTVKLLVMGNRAGAGHTHEDKGSFVLEFAGDTFAMDPGTCDYSDPQAGLLKNCERHTMLVPVGSDARAHPACPLEVDVKPHADGDGVRFAAQIDLRPGWESWYGQWRRSWSSPSPSVITIRDEYELTAGSGVEWYWQTALPVTVDGPRIVITGRHGRVRLQAPREVRIRVDELPLPERGVQRRIALALAGTAGTIEVTAHLEGRS